MKIKLALISLLLMLFVSWRWLLLPAVDAGLNQYLGEGQPPLSAEAARLHQSLLVGDLHADSFLWARDLADASDYGHLDLPRARTGNLAIQVFTAVTKSPRGLNYEKNASDAGDNITLLAVAQGWPPRTWDSLLERALYQSERLYRLASLHPAAISPVQTRGDLQKVLALREDGKAPLAAILGIEGAHPLEGKLENIGVLYDAGFRVMGLQHFFDNELGGSLHGLSGAGLTDFGREAVLEMARRSVIIDVAHSSEQVVRDVLSLTERPLIVSHTGLKGHCDSARNISDDLMQEIAAGGGLVGVGFWDGAVCDPSPESVVRAIRYAIDLLGIEHVALGSDYDGTVAVTFDAGELGVLTEEMLRQGFTETEIRRVMGENLRDFLLSQLPRS
ncbi:Membrane dipeptidase (Peptidase family M19) [Microbulbifer aggregans]|uniref:Membrane dipeptidase (Peptidase family M19) n=1 Tax=Microbulbifer aggregans TaxID=1769779 RepID=A0A1C9WAN5_9GAMM|nr:membrane dipeptidase [Microbulbifer aggregans]AOS98183.1 Membrane dipeptidase (Peptidase family M19) [Microbulbifer aggregans]